MGTAGYGTMVRRIGRLRISKVKCVTLCLPSGELTVTAEELLSLIDGEWNWDAEGPYELVIQELEGEVHLYAQDTRTSTDYMDQMIMFQKYHGVPFYVTYNSEKIEVADEEELGC